MLDIGSWLPHFPRYASLAGVAGDRRSHDPWVGCAFGRPGHYDAAPVTLVDLVAALVAVGEVDAVAHGCTSFSSVRASSSSRPQMVLTSTCSLRSSRAALRNDRSRSRPPLTSWSMRALSASRRSVTAASRRRGRRGRGLGFPRTRDTRAPCSPHYAMRRGPALHRRRIRATR